MLQFPDRDGNWGKARGALPEAILQLAVSEGEVI